MPESEFQTRSASRKQQIDPHLKEFIDRVIVPALVREYLAQSEKLEPKTTQNVDSPFPEQYKTQIEQKSKQRDPQGTTILGKAVSTMAGHVKTVQP